MVGILSTPLGNVRLGGPICDVTTGGRRGGALLRGADAVLLPERETRTGQVLAIAFPLIRLDLHQHRTESLVGDDGARLDQVDHPLVVQREVPRELVLCRA